MTMSETVHVRLRSQIDLCSLKVRDHLLHMHKTSHSCVHPGISEVYDKIFYIYYSVHRNILWNDQQMQQ